MVAHSHGTAGSVQANIDELVRHVQQRDDSARIAYEELYMRYVHSIGPAAHVLQYVRAFGAWKTPVAALKKCVFNTDEPPRRVISFMASGMAVRNDEPFAGLQQQHRKTWALDMEAAAFYLALHAFPDVDGLVVKGVCDYADPSKDDAFHDFAARASAIYLLTFIQEFVTGDILLRKQGRLFPDVALPYGDSKSFLVERMAVSPSQAQSGDRFSMVGCKVSHWRGGSRRR